MNLGYDGEHVGFENLAAIIGGRRRKQRGTGEDTVTGSLADIFTRVLRATCNDRGVANFEHALRGMRPAQECDPLLEQALALFGSSRGTPQNEAKARGRGHRLGLGRREVRYRCRRKWCARVRRRRSIGQRTANDYCGWSARCQIALKLDSDEDDYQSPSQQA